MMNFKILSIISLVCWLSIPVSANDNPVAGIEANSPRVYACENFILKSNSIDKDGWITGQEWTLKQGERNIFLGSQPEITLGLPYTRAVGDLEVFLEVTDNSNDPATNKDTESIRLYTRPNPAPRIERIDQSEFPNNRGSFYPDEKFSLNAIMYSDAIMGSATIKWNYNKSIFYFSSDAVANPEVMVVSAPDSYEFYSLVTVEVTNACGEKGTGEIRIPVKKIPVNSPPKVKLIVPSSANESAEFWLSSAGSTTGNGYNEPEDSLTYSWSCFRQGVKDNLCASGDSAVLVAFSDGGILVDVSLKICDEFGACDSAKSGVFIEETEDDVPTADASATARTAYLGENFSLDCSLSKDDRDAMDAGLQFCRWKLWTTVTDPAGKTLVVTEELLPTKKKVIPYKFNISGVWNAELRVSDEAMHLSGPNTIQITVLKGKPLPSVTSTIPVSVPAVTPQIEQAAPEAKSGPSRYEKPPPFVAPRQTPAASAFLTVIALIIAYGVYRQKKL